MQIVFNGLTDEQKIRAAKLATAANLRLANGTPLHMLPVDELQSYCVMRELDLSLALTELARRGEGVAGVPDVQPGFMQ